MKSPIDGPAFRPEGAATDLRTDCAIGVMAKSPRAGYSKTRLCPPLRPEQAARLSAAFLRDTTDTLRAAAACVPIAGYAAYAPAGTKEALIPHLAPGTLGAAGQTAERCFGRRRGIIWGSIEPVYNPVDVVATALVVDASVSGNGIILAKYEPRSTSWLQDVTHEVG